MSESDGEESCGRNDKEGENGSVEWDKLGGSEWASTKSEIGQTRSFCEAYDRVQGRLYIKAIKVWQIGWCGDDDEANDANINVKLNSDSYEKERGASLSIHSCSIRFVYVVASIPRKNLRIRNTCVPRQCAECRVWKSFYKFERNKWSSIVIRDDMENRRLVESDEFFRLFGFVVLCEWKSENWNNST